MTKEILVNYIINCRNDMVMLLMTNILLLTFLARKLNVRHRGIRIDLLNRKFCCGLAFEFGSNVFQCYGDKSLSEDKVTKYKTLRNTFSVFYWKHVIITQISLIIYM